MFNIFTIAPLLFFMITSYYFNDKKMTESKSYVLTISLLEALLSYLLVVVLFIQGFLSIFYLLLIIIIILLPILALILISLEGSFGLSDILELESIKNNLILFAKTFLPFYVFLTVFRYLPFYFQIPLAILISALIFYVSTHVYRLLTPFYKKISFFFSTLGPKEYFSLWISVVLILISIAVFQFPANVISENLNLSNNTKYLDIDGFPTDINNNFHQEEILQITPNIFTEPYIDPGISDYYYNDTHLYIYTDTNRLIAINLSTEEIVFDEVIETGTVLDEEGGVYQGSIYSKFINYNGYLILLGNKDTFLITPDSATLIADFSSYYTMYYYSNDELYFLNKASESIFNIYKFDDGIVSLTEEIDLEIEKYDNMTCISERLFYEKNNKHILYEDTSITFDISAGIPLYDADKQIMYYSISDYFNTEHIKTFVDQDASAISLQREHNYIGILINERIYYTANLETKESRVEIVNDDFEMMAIYNHQELEPFWVRNFYTNSYISNYQENNNTLEFLQVDENYKEVVLTIYQLEERDVDINLPFYTHYGLGIFLSMTFFFLLPITNHEATFAEIGFDAMTQKNKNKKE